MDQIVLLETKFVLLLSDVGRRVAGGNKQKSRTRYFERHAKRTCAVRPQMSGVGVGGNHPLGRGNDNQIFQSTYVNPVLNLTANCHKQRRRDASSS